MDEPCEVAVAATPPKSRKLILVGVLTSVVVLLACGVFAKKYAFSDSPNAAPPSGQVTSSTDAEEMSASASSTPSVPVLPAVAHVPLPAEVRGLYLTGWTAGSKRAETLLAYASSSQLNTFVIDLKLDDGTLSFVPKDPTLTPYAPKFPAIRDLDGLLERLRSRNMYRVARIFIMRDRLFGNVNPKTVLHNQDGSVWHDDKGIPWLDPAAPEVADYALALAHEAYARGFDEIQFDYVRFPTDGRIHSIVYPVYDTKTPMASVMRAFFGKVGGTLQTEHIPVSFDVFGLTYWSNSDLGIGQRLADAYPFADAVSPMVYPSHYYAGFEGFANPAQHPYEVVKRTLDKGVEVLQQATSGTDPGQARKKFRPWIQDFDLGAQYDAAMVQAQIKAARDAGAAGWLIWNARNVYTPAKYVD